MTARRQISVRGRLAAPGSVLSTALLTDAVAIVASGLDGKVLDVGAGARPFESLLTSASRYVAVDRPRSFDAVNPTAYADAAALPFLSGAFDGALLTEVLEHVSDDRQVLVELRRVLRLGGQAVVSVPFVHELHEVPHDYRRYTSLGIRSALESAGFEVVRVDPVGSPLLLLTDLASRQLVRWVRALGRLPYLRHVESLAQTAFVELPQRAALRKSSQHAIGTAHNRPDHASVEPPICLGYVALAKAIA